MTDFDLILHGILSHSFFQHRQRKKAAYWKEKETKRGKRQMKGKISKTRKFFAGLSLLCALWMIFSPTSRALRALPNTFRISVGQSYALNTGVAALSSQDEKLDVQGGTLSAREAGDAEVTVNLFGLIPIGRMRVTAGDETRLMPGGAAVGVAMTTKGVLVVGVSDVAGKSPAQSAGLRAGDVIESVNGKEIDGSQHLTELIASSGGSPLSLIYDRGGQKRTALLTPALDSASGAYRMGAWVRDSTAGVGTLSYYNSADGDYGALGHAINDGDTGKLLPVKTGALMQAEIVDVKKGQRGTPGELRGSFLRENLVLGDIRENTNLGIYGKLNKPYVNPLYPEGLPIGYQESVKTGPAAILSTLDGEGVKEYQVEIIQATRQIAPSPKSMIIRVTDPALLQKTGGIVQGMSGSPIIQNGRIVGAVTHVSV